jgi:citrate synthase
MSEYARGLEGVIANESSLSNVIGDVGELSYVGYHIDDLVQNCCYEEIVFLLHHNRLPDQAELLAFEKKLRAERALPQPVIDFLKTAPKDASPMDVLRTAVSMLGMYDQRAKIGEPDLEADAAIALSLCAKSATIVAAYHRFRNDLELPPIREDLTEAQHFLYLITGEVPTDTAARVLDVALILHADHGMNASTFSARVTVATLSDMYSAITAAIGTLKGPLHGGANEGVIHMLQDIGELEKVDAWVEGKLTRKEKIMGIGHRVYKVLDPRAPHLRRLAILLTEELGEPKWIKMSERIAEIMRERKKLEANVDFYSATV